MSRRQSSAGPMISLFPFLSVLSCVIGTLALIISALVLSAFSNDTVDRDVEHAALVAQLASDEVELEHFQTQMREAEAIAVDLVAAQARLRSLREEIARADEHSTLRRQLAALDAQKTNLQSGILAASTALAKAQKPRHIEIRPSGSGKKRRPLFVECGRHAIIVRAERPVTVGVSEVDSSAAFDDAIRKVVNDRKMTMIFLIRPDGVPTFEACRKRLVSLLVVDVLRGRSHGESTEELASRLTGTLPIPGYGPIDLSLFDGAGP